MVTASVSHTKDDLPDTQNDAAALPQELSGFLAGRISPNIGLFSQFTYAGADGAFGIDNVDLRFAAKTTVGGSAEMTYGLTVNNNPTVQDLWNTTPAWSFPFIGSEGAPGRRGEHDDRRRALAERAGAGELRDGRQPGVR